MKFVKLLIYALILAAFTVVIVRYLMKPKTVSSKVVTIQSRELVFEVATRSDSVGEVLAEQGYAGADSDFQAVVHGMRINAANPVSIILIDGGEESRLFTHSETVGDLLWEQKLALAATDRVSPGLAGFLAEDSRVVIDRIVDLEVTEVSEIPYKIVREHDPDMYYGSEVVTAPGSPGRKERQFTVTYKNGIETKRRMLSERILQSPADEIQKFGTKIEVLEVAEGRASWYAYKKCMCAAHPFFDLGRFVRVTSIASGKSAIVRINDRGPDLSLHPDRVIDLDSVVFREFAALGAGTIAVKVELLRQ